MGKLLDQWRQAAPSADGYYAPLPVYLAEVLDDPAILDPQTALSEDRHDAFLHDLALMATLLSTLETNLVPRLPSWGPHWRYLSRTAHVAQLIGAPTFATACHDLLVRLEGYSEDDIAAVCNHNPPSNPADAEELGALLDATHGSPAPGVLKAALLDSIAGDFGGVQPTNGLLPQSDRLVALIEEVRQGRDIPAPPPDPALRAWIDSKTVASPQPARNNSIPKGDLLSRLFGKTSKM